MKQIMMAWEIGVDFHQLKSRKQHIYGVIYNMHKLTLIIFLLLTGCNQSTTINPETEQPRTEQIQKEIDSLLAEDKANKMLELEYLEQIRIAQENNDTQAFEFFFQEYVEIERLEIPEELKKEPNYFLGGNKVKY